MSALEEHRRRAHIGKNKRCRICKHNKGGKRPFKKKNTYKALRFNHVVSFDVCGPLPVSFSGYKYWVIAVDSYTGWTEVYPVKTKNGATEALEQWHHDNGKPEVVRSDNGGEFKGSFTKYCQKFSIFQRFTVPYSPEQNGRAEAANKVVAVVVRCLLQDANLGPEYWAYAAKCGAYVLNRVSRKCLDGENSYRRRHGTDPKMDNLRVFGSKCFFSSGRTEKAAAEVHRTVEGRDFFGIR